MAYLRNLRSSAGARLAGALLAVTGLCVGMAEGDARQRAAPAKPPRVADAGRPASEAPMSSRYAAIVVDAKTGRVLHEVQADASRHPASLTKIMTLYLLFEEIEAGRVTLDTEFVASARGAMQAPSKLGLRPGQTIRVVDAIRALVTKSANDVAVTIAENVAGSEEAFAARMTRTARRIGMASTIFRNASGLPDPNQVTTARDMALLGRAIQERFPAHYRFFATPRFAWGRAVHANHNRLLGRIEGIDGIKTGYTLASGFNLVSSLRRDNRHLVAVVLGGPTGRARDGRMAQLLATYIPAASPGPKVSFVVPNAAGERRVAAMETPIVRSEPVRPVADEAPGRPLVLAPALERAAVMVVAPPTPTVPAPSPREAARRIEETWSIPMPTPSPLGYMPESKPRPASRPRAAIEAAFDAVETATARPRDAGTGAETPPPVGWQIQIGAYDREDQALARIERARSGPLGPILAGLEPVTQAVQRGDRTLYRARLAGFADRRAADEACARLRRADIACFAVAH